MLLNWLRTRYALYKINKFVDNASEEEVREWVISILKEGRQEAFRNKQYESVDELSDVLERLENLR